MAEGGVDPYAPCPCGSGKKHKFCCRGRERAEADATGGVAIPGFGIRPLGGEWEAAEQEGRALIDLGRFREAIEPLRRAARGAPRFAPPHNNLALALYADGDVLAALEVAESVQGSIQPGNVFTLGILVHLHLLTGNRARAEELAKALDAIVPPEGSAAYKKCEALARFRWHDRVYATARGALPGEAAYRPAISFFAGTAAANLSRYDEALLCLRQSTSEPQFGRRAERYVRLLERGQAPGSLDGDWPYLGYTDWMTPGMVERWKTKEDAAHLPGIVEALLAGLNDGPRQEWIELLAGHGTQEAVVALRKIAEGTFGTASLRASALTAICAHQDKGPWPAMRAWIDGRWTEVRTLRMEASDATATPVPPEVAREANQMLELMHAGRFADAEALGQTLLVRAPRCLKILQNVAACAGQQGRTAEAEALTRKALEIDPTYLFAWASLIDWRVAEGKLEKARALRKLVQMPERAHPLALAAIVGAQGRLAAAEGDWDGLRNAAETVLKIDSAGPQAEWARRALRSAPRGASKADRKDKVRRRLLTAAPSLSECLDGLSKVELIALGVGRGLPVRVASRKADLVACLAAALGDEKTICHIVDALSEVDGRALRALLEAGGRKAFAEFTKECGGDKDGSTFSALKSLGLVFEGSIGGLECVVVPFEVLNALQPPLH